MIGGSATQHGALGGDGSATINLPVAGSGGLARYRRGRNPRRLYRQAAARRERTSTAPIVLGGRAAFRFETDSGWTFDLIGIGQTTRRA